MDTVGKDSLMAPFSVDGVEFDLCVSAMTPTGQEKRRFVNLSKDGEVYEPVMTRCLAKLVAATPEPHFMDIGSFIGYYACYVGSLLRGRPGSVSAIESDGRRCQAIRRSCDANGLEDVTVLEAMLSDGEEAARVAGLGIEFGTYGNGTSYTVTLDQLIPRISLPTPNIVKMDIHGGEGKALLGMRQTLGQLDYLLLELHSEDRLEQYSPGVARSDILELFWSMGLSVFHVAGHVLRPSLASRASIRSGRFAYRAVTPASADLLLFDRTTLPVFLLVARVSDLEAVMGESLDDPFLSL